MLEQLQPLVGMCLQGLSDPHARVSDGRRGPGNIRRGKISGHGICSALEHTPLTTSPHHPPTKPPNHQPNQPPPPQVRWSACQALGQMCTDLTPDIQEQHGPQILPALMAAMDDFDNPRWAWRRCCLLRFFGIAWLGGWDAAHVIWSDPTHQNPTHPADPPPHPLLLKLKGSKPTPPPPSSTSPRAPRPTSWHRTSTRSSPSC
jgi:hypothetical protein